MDYGGNFIRLKISLDGIATAKIPQLTDREQLNLGCPPRHGFTPYLLGFSHTLKNQRPTLTLPPS
jgi:hypothetical protein